MWLKKHQVILYIVAGSILFILLGLYLGRGSLLRYVADKHITRLEKRFGLEVQYDALSLDGFNTVHLRGLSVVPLHRDTLLTLKTLDVSLGFWQLLRGQPDISNVQLDDLDLRFIKHGTVANYDFLFFPSSDKEKPTPDEESDKLDYTRRVDALMRLLFGLLPENGDLQHMQITERKDSSFVAFSIPSFHIADNRFRSQITVEEDTLTQQWTIQGELSPANRRLNASLHTPQHGRITLPYINRRFGAQVQLDSLTFSLTEEESTDDLTHLCGTAQVKGLQVFHHRLSPEVINLDRGEVEYRLNVSPRAVELDSSSHVRFNALTFHPYLRAERLESDTLSIPWHFTASVRKPWFPSQELFGSLPTGLFGNLDGIRTQGQLSYHFLFDVNFSQLDSLRLESELKTKGFRIESFGHTYLGKMSEEFEYTAYEHGQPVRTFPVGPSWEHFTPLDSVSPLLQMSVMQSEDGGFFYHQGFLPDALREALIHDLKVRRFARGGSTISMQLVKNVFLNRNKNMARKLEEALIVWLIENQRLTSKARMYEVYLNIAEWGPMIYGIHEAADFYFGKCPSQLSIEECIYLASIIPKPKRYRSLFTEEGGLKENQEGYFRLISARLVKKGLISEEEAAQVNANKVVLKQREQPPIDHSLDIHIPPAGY